MRHVKDPYNQGYDEGYSDGYCAAIDDAGWIKKLVQEQHKATLMTNQRNIMSWQWAQKELRRLQKAVLFFTKTPTGGYND
jgi:serine/threonine-protein kinase RIO1